MDPTARCAMADPVPNAKPSATTDPKDPIRLRGCAGGPATSDCTLAGAPGWGLGAPSDVVSFVWTFHLRVSMKKKMEEDEAAEAGEEGEDGEFLKKEGNEESSDAVM